MSEANEKFLALLEAATRATGVAVYGCGCCGSPSLGDAALDDVTYREVTYRGRYASDVDQDVGWESGYDQCLEVHRAEWQEIHRYFYKDLSFKEYGGMNTEQFGHLILSGEVAEAKDNG